ncbi:hypothetical protein [Legionella clemsonensis]|uniref:Uncharacterized protein n=1 Tax=Legionella clemsonensis TaxID=1867846 RepID=A0A222NZK7_9GAMM|nr:hypothetical protein [Legionella clemsonensis]ASQ45034.1 hypothetical protein clem_02360 [Legionella clemsonensis]
MLVSQVYKFINALTDIEHNLGPHDQELLHAFKEKYPLSNSETEANLTENADLALNGEELQWIQEVFAKRWTHIADTSEDYTFDPRGNNIPWITFARELGKVCKKPYLMVLMPKLESIDPEKFLRLEDDQDPRSIYLSNDDKTWHRVKGLLERLQQPSAVFSTFDVKKILPRALTLKEMFRIRSKKGDELAKEIDNETYANLWDYIMRRFAPTWQQKGKCPEHLLPDLLEVVECYFNAKAMNQNLKVFHQKLKNFTKDLEACPLEDINHFYGIEIFGREHNHYLVNILLDCFNETPDLEEKLADVARWICRFDPTLVSKCENLLPVYKILKVGEYFDLTHLRQLINKLDSNAAEIKPKIHDFLEKIPATGEISKEIITEIKKLYAFRWQIIKDSPHDYLRKQNEENRSWIRLAQYLAGAGYIEANYYKLLIPTLTEDSDPISKEILTNFPLSRFILSEDEKELIYLPNCVSQHQANGTFYHFSGERFRKLTAKEIERLPFAELQFYEYYAQVVAIEEECLPIKKSTVMALKELVNGTLNPYALRLGHSITSEQERIAEEAYFKFFGFLNNLPEDELARLYAHTVIWRGQKRSVQEILAEVQLNETPEEDKNSTIQTISLSEDQMRSGEKLEEKNSTTHQKENTSAEPIVAKEVPLKERECIAFAGQFFAKLVADYAPEEKFNQAIEENALAALDDMRLCSAQLVFRNWDFVDDKEATRRALTILVSLITHNFSCIWGTGSSLQFWDQKKNIITATGKELFKALEYALDNGDFSKIRFTYTYTMRNIVKRALEQNDFIRKYIRYKDTLDWLESIKDESMFEPRNQVCFEPELLLSVLTSLTERCNAKTSMLIENFLDELIKTRIQPENQYQQWVRINVEFNKLLNNKALPPKARHLILQELRKRKISDHDNDLNEKVVHFITRRLARVSISSTNQYGMFNTTPGKFGAQYNETKKRLEQYISSLELSSKKEITISELISQFKIGIKGIVNSHNIAMTQYLESLTQSIPLQHVGDDIVQMEPISLKA